MSCNEKSYDNRESCINIMPSGCVPYTGYISDTIKDSLPCKPNVNDIIKKMQELIDKLNVSNVDNTGLDKHCFTFTPATVKQSELNQLFITELCNLKDSVAALGGGSIDAGTIKLAIDILCLKQPSCAPQAEYTLQEILTKLISAYCDLETRIKTIETLLNI
jgi:hypothetical protein